MAIGSYAKIVGQKIGMANPFAQKAAATTSTATTSAAAKALGSSSSAAAPLMGSLGKRGHDFNPFRR